MKKNIIKIMLIAGLAITVAGGVFLLTRHTPVETETVVVDAEIVEEEVDNVVIIEEIKEKMVGEASNMNEKILVKEVITEETVVEIVGEDTQGTPVVTVNEPVVSNPQVEVKPAITPNTKPEPVQTVKPAVKPVVAAPKPTTPAPAPTPAPVAPKPAPTPAPVAPKPTPAPAPAPAPVVTTKEESVTESVAYKVEERQDANLPQGERKVVTSGKNGTRTIVYTVTLTDGRETGRVVKSNNITTAAVNEVVSVGTMLTDKWIEMDKKYVPAGFSVLKSGGGSGAASIYKNGEYVGNYNGNLIGIARSFTTHEERQSLMVFFGRVRANRGYANETDKYQHILDYWNPTTEAEEPNYPGINYRGTETNITISH